MTVKREIDALHMLGLVAKREDGNYEVTEAADLAALCYQKSPGQGDEGDK